MPRNITFKASTEKYVLIIHADASITEVYRELQEFMVQLNSDAAGEVHNELFVRTGRRLLIDEEKQALYSIIEAGGKWKVNSIKSDVITTEAATQWSKEVNTRVEFRNVFSGERLETRGDVLLVGDVEPGGFIRATGNIFILGDLQGIADAGFEGNDKAVVVGTFKNNSRIRINKVDYFIEHSLGNKNISFPLVYFLTDQGYIDAVNVNEITEVRPDIDRVLSSFN